MNYLEGQPGSSTCINGVGLGNAPDGNWYFVEVMRHYNAGNYYATQRATGMTGGVANLVYQRSQQSGSVGSGWSAWVRTDAATLSDGSYGNASVADIYIRSIGKWASQLPGNNYYNTYPTYNNTYPTYNSDIPGGIGMVVLHPGYMSCWSGYTYLGMSLIPNTESWISWCMKN